MSLRTLLTRHRGDQQSLRTKPAGSVRHKIGKAGRTAAAATVSGLLVFGGVQTANAAAAGAVYDPPIYLENGTQLGFKNWTSTGLARWDGNPNQTTRITEGSNYKPIVDTTDANGNPLLVANNGQFAYNYGNVTATIEAEWLKRYSAESYPILQGTYAEGYFNTFKDTCFDANTTYNPGDVVTCDGSRKVTITFSEPVWFPKFHMQETVRALLAGNDKLNGNTPRLSLFEELKIASINDGARNLTSKDYGGVASIPFSPIYRDAKSNAAWYTEGEDADGNYINTLDLSKYAMDSNGLYSWNDPSITPAPGARNSGGTYSIADPQFGIPGMVKSITFEYTPKILVNDASAVTQYLDGSTTDLKGYGPIKIQDLLNWFNYGSNPQHYTVAALLPRTDYTVNKNFEDDTTPAAAGDTVTWTVSVKNQNQYGVGANSWGYLGIDFLPAEIDPSTVELVKVDSTQGDAATNTNWKSEVVDGKLRFWRVGDGYTVSGSTEPAAGVTEDYTVGTNLGRVKPIDPTNTTSLPTGGLNAGETDTWTFKAKTNASAILARFQAENPTCDPSIALNIKNDVKVYDSIVDPNAQNSASQSKLSATKPLVCPKAAISIEKTHADIPENAKPGDVVTYSFKVTNTGNWPLDSFEITDPLKGLSDITYPADRSLAPKESKVATATYTLTEADILAKAVNNKATVNGTPYDPTPNDPSDNVPPPTPSTDEDVVPLTPEPKLEMVKTADVTEVKKAGDVVNYNFHVTNTGNVKIDQIAINEVSFNGSGKISTPECKATTLAPKESTDCTATYTVTNEDIAAGKTLVNTATAGGIVPDLPKDPNGNPPTVTTPPSTAKVKVPEGADPKLEMVKTADVTEVKKAGDVVNYNFHVTNTGNVTIDNIAINEVDFNGSGKISTPECKATTLKPTESTDCTATYTVTKEDIAAGKTLVNTATAGGIVPGLPKDPNGNPPTVTTPPSTANVKVPGLTPKLEMVKTADRTQVVKAGDVVNYNFHVTNTGNAIVDEIVINEVSFNGAGKLSTPVCKATILAPNESTDCTATYTVTKADIAAGKTLVNTATASGKVPGVPLDKNGTPSTVTTGPSTAKVKMPAHVVTKLPNTGADVAALGAGALALLILGTGAVVLRRKTND